MLIIKNIAWSKQQCSTNEKVVLQVDIREKADFPFNYPHDYPVYAEGIAQPKE